jgi:hypothetical protein
MRGGGGDKRSRAMYGLAQRLVHVRRCGVAEARRDPVLSPRIYVREPVIFGSIIAASNFEI